jgi:hypothetical protein
MLKINQPDEIADPCFAIDWGCGRVGTKQVGGSE